MLSIVQVAKVGATNNITTTNREFPMSDQEDKFRKALEVIKDTNLYEMMEAVHAADPTRHWVISDFTLNTIAAYRNEKRLVKDYIDTILDE